MSYEAFMFLVINLLLGGNYTAEQLDILFAVIYKYFDDVE